MTWFEVLTRVMRPVFLLLLVLLAPLSTAFLTVGNGSPPADEQGVEVEITLSEGYWSQTNWNILKDNGIPAFQRQDWPVLYIDDQLIGIPGVSLNRAFAPNPSLPSYLKVTFVAC